MGFRRDGSARNAFAIPAFVGIGEERAHRRWQAKSFREHPADFASGRDVPPELPRQLWQPAGKLHGPGQYRTLRRRDSTGHAPQHLGMSAEPDRRRVRGQRVVSAEHFCSHLRAGATTHVEQKAQVVRLPRRSPH